MSNQRWVWWLCHKVGSTCQAVADGEGQSVATRRSGLEGKAYDRGRGNRFGRFFYLRRFTHRSLESFRARSYLSVMHERFCALHTLRFAETLRGDVHPYLDRLLYGAALDGSGECEVTRSSVACFYTRHRADVDAIRARLESTRLRPWWSGMLNAWLLWGQTHELVVTARGQGGLRRILGVDETWKNHFDR